MCLSSHKFLQSNTNVRLLCTLYAADADGSRHPVRRGRAAGFRVRAGDLRGHPWLTRRFSERTRRRRQSAGRWPGGGSTGRIRGRHFQEPIEARAGIGKPERAPTPSGAAGVVIVRKGERKAIGAMPGATAPRNRRPERENPAGCGVFVIRQGGPAVMYWSCLSNRRPKNLSSWMVARRNRSYNQQLAV